MIKQFYLTNKWYSNRYNQSCQSGPWSNGNEGLLQIPQSCKTGASPSDGFISYPGHLLWVSNSSAETQSTYSTTALADWALFIYNHFFAHSYDIPT